MSWRLVKQAPAKAPSSVERRRALDTGTKAVFDRPLPGHGGQVWHRQGHELWTRRAAPSSTKGAESLPVRPNEKVINIHSEQRTCDCEPALGDSSVDIMTL